MGWLFGSGGVLANELRREVWVGVGECAVGADDGVWYVLVLLDGAKAWRRILAGAGLWWVGRMM